MGEVDDSCVYFVRPPLLASTGAPSAMDIARNIGNAFTPELIELAKTDLPAEYTQRQLGDSVRFYVKQFFSNDLLYYILDELRTIWTTRRRAACIQAIAVGEEPYFFPAELFSAPNEPDHLDLHVAAFFNAWLSKPSVHIYTGVKSVKYDVTVPIRDRIAEIRNAMNLIANNVFSKDDDRRGRCVWSHLCHHAADAACARISVQ